MDFEGVFSRIVFNNPPNGGVGLRLDYIIDPLEPNVALVNIDGSYINQSGDIVDLDPIFEEAFDLGKLEDCQMILRDFLLANNINIIDLSCS